MMKYKLIAHKTRNMKYEISKHHCNIDRIYAGFLQSNSDSQEEFEKHQQHAEKDLYDAFELQIRQNPKPTYVDFFFHCLFFFFFLKKKHKKRLKDKQRFEEAVKKKTKKKKQTIIIFLELVVFPQVRVDQFESKCYQIHVFIVAKESENEFKTPTTIDEALHHPNYAGSRSIFGRGAECENCTTRDPYDIVIDVSHKLRELQLSRYKAAVKVLLLETTNEEEVFLDIAATPLPTPLLTGSLFEDRQSELNQANRQSQTSEEVAAMQRYLKRFGYYNDEIDGDFGPVTEQAVKNFQKASGLEITGLGDAVTKKTMTNAKRCSNVDGFSNNDMKDEQSLAVDYGEKTNLTYSIWVSPGYLNREKVVWCIQMATEQWADACDITMTYIDSSDEKSSAADIWYEWSDHTLHQKNVLRFDGNGGVLGEGGNGFVTFDSAERWVIGVDEKLEATTDVSSLDDPQTWIRGQPAISLYHTALHETGHALGLDHSNNLNDLMVCTLCVSCAVLFFLLLYFYKI
ncbi:hypothetical protein RFI_18882 [Reticulomyxa filosa]|uniref:Peptidase metallopeptidase domain-containing protein n=1 Tax=Reticulomyxa filosa TaxID=46433 RepID=X6MWM4_RETFI|nr:hypothetical protein RFI_18882 [Reticulomyxa filosa]|eukprot:ETO18383.1 hypothetical protein RFI_18882 [Reticulomyxa filosa]